MKNNWDWFINNQNLKIRFLTSLTVNIARIGLGFIGGVIIARGLEPAGYGNYSFLLGSFASIIALLDTGTSSGFYTFISRRRRGWKFYLYYSLWIAMQFLIIMSLITFIFPDRWRNNIWLGHPKGLIVLAFLASFMLNKVWRMANQVGESIRATTVVQLHSIIVAALHLCIILAMAALKCLTIPNLFIVLALTYFSVSSILAKKLRGNLIVKEEEKLPNMINEFRAYCLPLVISAVVGFGYSFANIWLLQKFGGAIQQGFYSVAQRFGSICLIATTSMLSIFWKEITEAKERGNKERLQRLYTKISRGLCFVGALGACFLIPFTKEILVFFLGPKYEAGWLCVAIMFLYPIYQSLGQINSSYFLAIAQTKLYSKISIIMMLVGIPVTYFVLANPSALVPGLGLGSVGLALKMVVLQIITVNALAYFICRLSKWSFSFLYQFAAIGFLLATSFSIKGFFNLLFNALNISVHPLAIGISCIPIYILIAGASVCLFPALVGMERKEIKGLVQNFNSYLTRRLK